MNNHLSLVADYFQYFISLRRHTFTGLGQLQILYFDGNVLLHIDPKAFSHIPHLIELHLQNNWLSLNETTKAKTIFDMEARTPFQYLQYIQILNLSHNNVSHFLIDWMMNNRRLVTLDLSHNNFSSFNFSQISNPWKSLTVDLRHNRIRNVSLRNDIVQLEHTHSKWILNENPLNCDCTLLNLAKLARNSEKSAFTYLIDDLSCASDAELLRLNSTCAPTPIWKVMLMYILGLTMVLAVGFLFCASQLRLYLKKVRMWLEDHDWWPFEGVQWCRMIHI